MQIWLYWSSWQFWKDLIRSDQKIDKVKNLMIYFNDYFIRNLIWSSLIHFDPFLTDLIQSDQKINKVENLIIYFNDYFIRNPIWSSLIHFDPFWTDLIQFDQKKLKIENLVIYFNDYFIRNWKCGKSGNLIKVSAKLGNLTKKIEPDLFKMDQTWSNLIK